MQAQRQMAVTLPEALVYHAHEQRRVLPGRRR